MKLVKETVISALLAVILLANVEACDPTLSCMNNGRRDENVCKCYCPPGFHGRNCEVQTTSICRDSNACDRNWQCFQGNSYGGFICTCKTGQCGWNCERQDYEMQRQCRQNPCRNGGYCSSELNFENGREICKAVCKCRNGFGGERCEIADPCRRNPCGRDNLAECFETSASRSGRVCVRYNSYGGLSYDE